MFLTCILVVAYVTVFARVIPQHIFAGHEAFGLPHQQTVRLWEEVTSLLWHIFNVCYMLATHVTFDFFFHATLTLDVSDSYSPKHDVVRLLLASNMAYYVGMLLVSLWLPRRRDWREMVFHHIVTICLMGVAYQVGFYYISIFVLFINAIADTFLSSSKIAFDLDSSLQSPLFACFVVAHVILRVIFYPFKVWVCVSTSVDQYQSAFDFLPGLCTIPLWFLYLFWTPKIFMVCWKRIVHGVRNVDKSVRQKKSSTK